METSSLIFYPRIFLPSVIIAIIIHELIHGICFAQFAKGGIKSVHFGVKWKYLTPYCHCSESVNVQQYRIALVMPSVVLGFIPSVSGFIIHNFTIVMLGCTLIAAGIGDFIILWMLRNLPQNTRVVDHPDKIGFLYEDIQ
jgi:hypothetical protein